MSGIFNNDYRYTGFTPDKNAHTSLGILRWKKLSIKIKQ
jgi:hypothetical protein